MLNFEDEEREVHSQTVDAKEMAERQKYMKSLNKQIQKFCVDTLRDTVHQDIEETKDHCEYATDNSRT